jgi:chromosome segregation ATPase
MTQLEEKERRFEEASRQLREARTEAAAIEESIQIQEAKRKQELRDAAKADLEDSIKVFESLGIPKPGAEAAAKGRPESRF